MITFTHTFLISVLSGSATFIGLWLIGIFVEKSIMTMGKRKNYNSSIISLLAIGLKRICIVFGAISLAGSCGIDVRGIFAGLGLTGFALGFALKDLLANIIAGVFILLYKPFKLGQNIKVTIDMGKIVGEGKVTQIDLRYTTLENSTATILVPNSMLFTNCISLLKEATH